MVLNWLRRRSPERKLQHELGPAALIFRASEGGAAVSPTDWTKPGQSWTQGDVDRILLLRQLEEQGLSRWGTDDVQVPYQSLLEIELDDLQNLAPAPVFPYNWWVRSDGELSESKFRYLCEFLGSDGRPMVGLRRQGPFLRYGSSLWVLEPRAFRLLERLESCSERPQATFEERLLDLAEIHRMSEGLPVLFDEYLSSQTILVPTRTTVELSQDDQGGLSVLPVPDGVPRVRDFQRQFKRFPGVQKRYDLAGEGGRRVRVVLTSEVESACEQLRPLVALTRAEKENFLDDPHAFLSAEAIDLDDFHSRVKEIGVYRYRYFPYARQSEGGWVPDEVGIRIEPEDGSGEPANVVLDEASLERLVALITQARVEGRRSFQYQGRYFPADQSNLQRLVKLLELLRTEPPQPAVEEPIEELPGPPRLVVHDNVETLDFVAPMGDVQTVLDEERCELPVTLSPEVSLLPHQQHGLLWLQSLYKEGQCQGGLLADDMGLGKTLQIWSFVEWCRQREPLLGPVLVVAPVGLVENWCAEYLKFFTRPGSLKDRDLLRLHGEAMTPFRLQNGRFDPTKVTRFPVVLTSYATLRNYAFSFGRVAWSVVVLDEAQKVKNPSAGVTHAVKSLDSRFRIASTGTPVENCLRDLWCLMDFVHPGLVGCMKDFLREFVPQEESDYARLSGLIEKRAAPCFLRRRKADILEDLPPKHEHATSLPMGQTQEDQYLAAIAAYRHNRPDGQRGAFQLLMQLRRLSCCAAGFPVAEISDRGLVKAFSTKLGWLLETLESIRGLQEKAIVFVELKEIQRLLVRALEEHFEISVGMINGDVSAQNRGGESARQAIINRFESKVGFNVLILSPLAAGTGLTIVEANHVVHFLRHWNPAKEDQATDRVYRIGQKRPVHVYYPLAVGQGYQSFDQRLHSLLEQKRKLAESALFPTLYGQVEAVEMLDLLDENPERRGAALGIDDARRMLPGDFVKLVAALAGRGQDDVQLTGEQNNMGADILVRTADSQPNLAIRCASHGLVPAQAVEEVYTSLSHYQRLCSGALVGVVGCLDEVTAEVRNLASSRGVQIWDAAKLTQLLETRPVTWLEVLAQTSILTAGPKERELAEGARHEKMQEVLARALSGASQSRDTRPREGGAAWVSTLTLQRPDEGGLCLQLGPLQGLPKFVKRLTVQVGEETFALLASNVRQSSYSLAVSPSADRYQVLAPGFEDEVGEELASLTQPGLSEDGPLAFRVDAAGVGLPLRSRSLRCGASYRLLFSRNFLTLAPPEGIQAYGLGLDWTMWELSVPATPSPEWLLALGRLGLSVAGGRVQADWIGNTPMAWCRSKVLYPVFSVGDTPAVSVSGVRARENEVSAFLLGPDGLISVVIGAGDHWLLEMDELNEGDYLLEIVPRNTAIEPARLPFRVEPRTPVHLSCRTEVSLGEETINITCEHEVEWDLSQAETEGLTIRGPALWPVRLVGFGQRKLRVGPDGMLDLTGFLEHTRDQREKERMARVIVDFGELGRLSIEHRRQVSIKQLRQRLQQMFAANGHLSERAAHNQGLFLNGWLGPLIDLLGYHLRRHELEHSCSAFVLAPKVETEAELRALVLAPFGADLRESYAGSARELANLLCEQRGYSLVFLSDGIRWAVHENGRRFMGRPLHLGEALEDESGELLEEFLARHLAEGL